MAHQEKDFPPVRACLFDMDGLLIDSEDLYTLCTNTILREYGKSDLPWSIKAQLQGRPGPESGRIFQEWARLPISNADFMTKVAALQKRHFPASQPLPGVALLLKSLSNTSPRMHIALATSSHKVNFKLKTDHLQALFSAFPENQRVLGDDARIPSGKGKPAPDIYLLALKTINDGIRREGREREISPEECLVFEDSVPGIEAGRRAGMRVIWCPHPGLLQEYTGREAQVLAGLGSASKSEQGPKAAANVGDDIKGKEIRSGSRVEGEPGEPGDGWGQLLLTLEDFPYRQYGIHVHG